MFKHFALPSPEWQGYLTQHPCSGYNIVVFRQHSHFKKCSMNPFANILDDAALEVLTAIGAGFPAGRFYLAGGTTLALPIGHRRSLDLDFFQGDRKETISFAAVPAGMKKVFRAKDTVLETRPTDQVTWRINGTRVTFPAYPFGLVESLIAGDTIGPLLRGISLAPVREIALMKAYNLGRRAVFRDYVDLHFLLQKDLVTLDYIMTHAPGKLTLEGETVFSARLFLEQLVFFEDLPDREETLNLVDGSLSEQEVKALLAQKTREVLARAGGRKGAGAVKLPESFRPLFRNYLFDGIDPDRCPEMVVRTVLSRGTWEQVGWLFDHFGTATVREIFLHDYYGLRACRNPPATCGHSSSWTTRFLPTRTRWPNGVAAAGSRLRWDFRPRRTRPKNLGARMIAWITQSSIQLTPTGIPSNADWVGNNGAF